MSKGSKFQHKWLFDSKLAFGDKTHKWCLTYIDGKGMFLFCVAFIIQSMVMSQRYGVPQEMYGVEQKLLERTSKVRHQYIMKQLLVMRSMKYHAL